MLLRNLDSSKYAPVFVLLSQLVTEFYQVDFCDVLNYSRIQTNLSKINRFWRAVNLGKSGCAHSILFVDLSDTVDNSFKFNAHFSYNFSRFDGQRQKLNLAIDVISTLTLKALRYFCKNHGDQRVLVNFK